MFIFEPQCHTLVTFFLNLPKSNDFKINVVNQFETNTNV